MRKFCAFLMSLAIMVVSTGCSCPGGEAMPKLKRTVEVERLEQFVGNWQGTFEMKALGEKEPIKGSGTSSATWANADKTMLHERFTGEMGDMGKMEGIGVWMWDAKAKKYRNWWFEDVGTAGCGSTRYNEKTKTWHMRTCSRNTEMGFRTVGRGTIKAVDDNTLQWTFRDYIPFPLTNLPLMKVVSWSGTTTRNK
ncbi:MAG: DUF1579 family protein [Planctomycetota bacterium]